LGLLSLFGLSGLFGLFGLSGFLGSSGLSDFSKNKSIGEGIAGDLDVSFHEAMKYQSQNTHQPTYRHVSSSWRIENP
jgi:hypothetical protein